MSVSNQLAKLFADVNETNNEIAQLNERRVVLKQKLNKVKNAFKTFFILSNCFSSNFKLRLWRMHGILVLLRVDGWRDLIGTMKWRMC